MKIYILTFICLFILVFFGFSNTALGASSDIIFTEIMYNPSGSDTKKEWVEIYNSGETDVTLIEGSGTDSWRFNDGSNHTLTLFQGSLTISVGGYAILASDAQTFLDEHAEFSGTIIDTVMSLNNTSDTIKLSSDKGSTFFGDVLYEDTQGADGDGYSLQLSGVSWVAADSTQGQSTAVQEPQEESTPPESGSSSPTSTDATPGVSLPDSEDEPPAESGDSTKIKITEVFPNPIGDENQEFIELWNNQNESISLEGWKLADTSKVITLSEIALVPQEYFTIYRSATKIALNNSKETISLYDKTGNLIDSVEYSSTLEGYSFSYDDDKNKFLWSSTQTPSKSNEITTPNDPPQAVITFSNNPIAINEKVIISAQDSTDADDDKILSNWNIGKNFQAFGEKFKYSFNEIGSHIIKLTVSDGQHEVVATSTINILPVNDILSLRRNIESPILNASSTDATPRVSLISPAPDIINAQIYITEIFPNPTGRDDNEWIELYNPNEFDVVLNNWIIDDQDGGSRPHTILDRIIQAQSYLILGKEEIKITLNNSSDEVRLFNADEKLIDEVLYDDVQEEQSFSKSDDEFWFWTSVITPGEPNITDLIIPYSNPENPLFLTTSIPISSPLTDVVDIDLPDIRELELGTEVRVQGTVAVEPGILGKTYFYITGSPGIQVYFYKKDWPKLTVGDVVGVIGKLTESNNELRLKISNKEDIISLYTSDAPIPIETQTGNVLESLEGALIKITAELIEKKGTSWYLDDGTGEVKITFQPTANIKKPSTKEGNWIEVIGIVSETRSGYRILPRYQEDIRVMNEDELLDEDTGKILGEQTESNGIQRFIIPKNNTPNKILIYFVLTTSALTILFAGLFIKLYSETKKRNKKQD
jgi:DNA/RNA endonuclease YhcR with UshA esterase domain